MRDFIHRLNTEETANLLFERPATVFRVHPPAPDHFAQRIPRKYSGARLNIGVWRIGSRNIPIGLNSGDLFGVQS